MLAWELSYEQRVLTNVKQMMVTMMTTGSIFVSNKNELPMINIFLVIRV